MAEATIRNAEVVRSMGMLDGLTQRWTKVNTVALAASQSAAERGAAIMGFTKFLRFGVQMMILGLGALLVLEGQISGGAMIAASILLGRALAPVEQAMGAWRTFTSARIAYGRLKTRMDALPPEPERTALPEPRGALMVENLVYAPTQGEPPILRGVSFAVEPGEAVAVIGRLLPGKVRFAVCSSALRCPMVGACAWMGRRSATTRRISSDAGWVTFRKTSNSLLAPSARTLPA